MRREREIGARAEPRLASAPREELAVAIDRLYRQHHRAVFKLALRYGLGNESWAEDITQDVFMKLLDKLPTLEAHGELEPWLYRVTTNECLHKLRRERLWGAKIWRQLVAHNADGVAAAGVERQVFARQELERTRRALGELPARERVVICMVQLDGKSQREVCETLGLSKGYVSKLLARATAHLEEELDV